MDLHDLIHRIWLSVSEHLDRITYTLSGLLTGWGWLTENIIGVIGLIFIFLTYLLNRKKYAHEAKIRDEANERDKILFEIKFQQEKAKLKKDNQSES